jgi:large subunit ribosomal protein L24e
MVVKRQCSFCAGEIEPGTGSMFVKRDGSVFHFCNSSCRKQQLHLGRVGHRLKWTRAHALKRAAEQAGPKGSTPPAAPKKGSSAKKGPIQWKDAEAPPAAKVETEPAAEASPAPPTEPKPEKKKSAPKPKKAAASEAPKS